MNRRIETTSSGQRGCRCHRTMLSYNNNKNQCRDCGDVGQRLIIFLGYASSRHLTMCKPILDHVHSYTANVVVCACLCALPIMASEFLKLFQVNINRYGSKYDSRIRKMPCFRCSSFRIRSAHGCSIIGSMHRVFAVIPYADVTFAHCPRLRILPCFQSSGRESSIGRLQGRIRATARATARVVPAILQPTPCSVPGDKRRSKLTLPFSIDFG